MRLKQHCSVWAAAVGKAQVVALVQVLLKYISKQQWGALIQTSTSAVLLLLGGPTWSSTSVFWLPILPEEQIWSAPLSYQFKKRKAVPPLNITFQKAEDSPPSPSYLTVAVTMRQCRALSSCTWKPMKSVLLLRSVIMCRPIHKAAIHSLSGTVPPDVIP